MPGGKGRKPLGGRFAGGRGQSGGDGDQYPGGGAAVVVEDVPEAQQFGRRRVSDMAQLPARAWQGVNGLRDVRWGRHVGMAEGEWVTRREMGEARGHGGG